jgi:hypothetical protein
MDITIGSGPDGRPLAHRPDCPDVAVLRAAGEPLMTLFEVDRVAVREMSRCSRHSCLDPELRR